MPSPRRPYTDPNSRQVLLEAIEFLALLRGINCPAADPTDWADPGDQLHLAWTLAIQIHTYLPELITAAHDHGYTTQQILTRLTPPAR